MLYIVTKLVTEGQQKAFSIIGASEDKKRAASIAAEVYKDYNKNASFQNIEMITEWLATRQNYSFRKDKDHRLQLAITALEGEVQPEEKQLVFSAAAEEEELMRRVSQALFEGKHTAERGPKPRRTPARSNREHLIAKIRSSSSGFFVSRSRLERRTIEAMTSLYQ